ncbi:MAG: PH domain-containing protein [Christensenellales bacterium]
MKTLERKYAKIDRIVAKGRFSAWTFVLTALVATVLGGIVAVIWIFKDQIEALFTKTTPAQHLTDDVMRWVLLGVACAVVVCFLLQLIKFKSKELVLTEDKVVYREGFLNVRTVVIPLAEIKMVETKQNALQRLVGVGGLLIVSDAEQPYLVRGVKSADRMTRRIMRQIADMKKASETRGTRMQIVGRVAGRA